MNRCAQSGRSDRLASRFSIYSLLFIFASGLASELCACNIPVYRYALERWQCDKYQLIVFGSKSSNELHQVQGSLRSANVDFVYCKPGDSQEYESIWKRLTRESRIEAPHFVVRRPIRESNSGVICHSPFNQYEISRIATSPTREELARRILAGHAIVWLVIESDDRDENERIRLLLETSLAQLQKKIQLPEGIGLPGSEIYSEVPLLLRFSQLAMKPSDDDPLIRALTKSHDLAAQTGSVVLPVFGRGRALEVIPAADLTHSLVEDITIYLSSACSCQVKERNPGFDLLLAVDWQRQLFDEEEPPTDRPNDDNPSGTGNRGGRTSPSLVPIPPGRAK